MLQILREHKGFGRQIFLLSKNELIKTYKKALLGPAWAIMKPLFTMFVYWFAIQFGIRGSSVVAGVPRFAFIVAGFTPWYFMSESINLGAKAIRLNSQFVTKINFPVSAIMTYTMLARLYTHLMLCVLMYVYMLATGYAPMLQNIQFFFYMPMMFLFFLMLTWVTAPLSVFSKDFENLIGSIMTGLLWLSGILWDSYSMDIPWLQKLMLFNPINFFANGYRKTFLYGEWFFQRPLEVYVFLAELVIVAILGSWNYQRLRKRLPDVL